MRYDCHMPKKSTIVEIRTLPYPHCKGDTIDGAHTYCEVAVELLSGEIITLPKSAPSACPGCYDRSMVTCSAKTGKEMKWINRAAEPPMSSETLTVPS